MSDEHGWPDFSHPDGPDDHGEQHGGDEPAAAADSPFHDELFGHDDAGADGFDGLGADGDPGESPDVAGGWDDQYEPGTGHDDAAAAGVVDVTDGHGLGPVGADPDAVPDAEQVGVFPPVVDIGPLPEPVDGFPWIDTGSLGLYHSGPVDAAGAESMGAGSMGAGSMGAGSMGAGSMAAEPVPAQDLAAYAGEELAPGADPWAALADSDDPATSALAQWWRPQG